jgi:hypothetical protein
LQHNKPPYKQITLVRLSYEYARSEASRDTFLSFFFQYTDITIEISPWEQVRIMPFRHFRVSRNCFDMAETRGYGLTENKQLPDNPKKPVDVRSEP